MYEALIKRLQDFAAGTERDKDAQLAFEAADAIEELRDRNVWKWIPVTERLPKEENRSYWICTDTGYQCECRWTNNYFGIGESGEWGWCIVDVPQYHKVVAWMDLPKPYKPPKEEPE